MIYCDSPSLEEWSAPPQHAPCATLTQLRAGEILLSNAIELADWDSNPAWPIVCDECWLPSCGGCGLARIVRLNGQILWLPPRIEDFDESLRDWLGGDWRFLSEAVLIPESAWTNLHRLCSRLPAAHRFPRAVRRDLMRLWQWDMPSAVDVERPYQLEGWPAGTALASEPLDLDATSTVICSLCEWCQSEPEGAVAGRFVRLEDWGGQVNIVYFDVQPPQEWRAFGVGLENGFVIATDWVFQNGTADPEISDTEGPPKIEECHDLNRHRDGAKDVRQRFPR